MAAACTAGPQTLCGSWAGSLTAASTWCRPAGGKSPTWRSATNSWCVAPPTGGRRSRHSENSREVNLCSSRPQIGVSHELSSVSSYVVDLKRVKKSGGSVIQGIIQDNQPLTEPKDAKGAALRRSYERPTTTCSSQRSVCHLSVVTVWITEIPNSFDDVETFSYI